ncbi:MAG: DUF5693 family protein [Oscillospiraceae bacterium]
MKNQLRENWIMVIVLIAGLVCSLILCGVRAGMESGDTGVSLIMSHEDVAALASAEGISYDDYAEKLLSSGLTAIFTPGKVCDELNLFIGDSYNGEDAVVGMPEDNNQYSYIPINGFEYSEDAHVVRVFKLIPEYAARYNVLGYSGPEEIENLTYRTVTDRNIRVIWLCPFTDASTGKMISHPEDYISVIQGVGTRIQPHGLHLGQFSVLAGYTPNLWLILGVIAGTVSAGILILGSAIRLRRSFKLILLVTGFLAGSFLWNVCPWLMPLAAAVIYPCLGIWLIAELLARVHPGTSGLTLLTYCIILAAGFAVALIGANAIAAMQSSRAYLLAVNNFRGVKLSQLLPLIYAVFICTKKLYRGKTGHEVLGEYRNSWRIAAAALLVMLLAAVLYILRTGDGFLSASTLEQRFRDFLEHILIVRPRTKEFLVAWPSLAAAVVLIVRGSRRYALPFAIFSSVGLASVVNTFCHSRSPLWLSLSRVGIGLLAGAVIGTIVILIFAPRKQPSQK